MAAASTIRQFDHPAPIGAVVDSWAATHGYKRVAEDAGGRTWQKGIGFLVAPMMLKASQQGSQVTVEAWIRAGTFVRLFALFLIPAQMGIESGGFKMALPRKIARTAVNDLLARLGQPPIS